MNESFFYFHFYFNSLLYLFTHILTPSTILLLHASKTPRIRILSSAKKKKKKEITSYQNY